MTLYRRSVRVEEWIPVGVESLEANALEVVRSTSNCSVIAGPGSGKTELLAQRAAFLLQTGGAPRPQRILAISFKRDAAANLAARVRRRCHPDHSARLDSLTFDAFAKTIVDRFGQALPVAWRPRLDYQIVNQNESDYRNYLGNLGGLPSHLGGQEQIIEIQAKSFERKHLFGAPLPKTPQEPSSAVQWAVTQYWQSSLHGSNGSFLSFPMIGRLAELVLRVNPVARTALSLTYSHLFLDEFQDTTQVQYDLVKTVFLDSPTVLTAVGDNKQQIMRWAMAMDDPFAVFERDFRAERTSLLNNYRSSPDLVRIQHVLAQALDARSIAPVSKTKGAVIGESCEIWDFSTSLVEANTLAEFIIAQMDAHGLAPRDFVLLVRQRATRYAQYMAPVFEKHGLLLRNEDADVGKLKLQQLLSEELSELVIRLVHLATAERAGPSWSECQEALSNLRGISLDDNVARSRLGRELSTFCDRFRTKYPIPVVNETDAVGLVSEVLGFIGRESFAAAYQAYRQGTWMDDVAQAVAIHMLGSCEKASNWSAAIAIYDGLNSLPLMTIHKSKGLEYHTVIFIGLDDEAWWSFARDKIEATAGFFVAFTRAKQRVLFTYCARNGRRKTIAPLYGLLQSAGVRVKAVG